MSEGRYIKRDSVQPHQRLTPFTLQTPEHYKELGIMRSNLEKSLTKLYKKV